MKYRGTTNILLLLLLRLLLPLIPPQPPNEQPSGGRTNSRGPRSLMEGLPGGGFGGSSLSARGRTWPFLFVLYSVFSGKQASPVKWDLAVALSAIPPPLPHTPSCGTEPEAARLLPTAALSPQMAGRGVQKNCPFFF